MKRNIVIAAVTAAALIGGGTAVAFAGDDAPEQLSASGADTAKDARTDLKAAVDAALKHTPGTATSADFDDGAWEVEITSKDGKEHDLNVDAKTAKVTADDGDDDAQDDRDDDTKDDDRDDDDAKGDDRGNDDRDDRGDDGKDDDAQDDDRGDDNGKDDDQGSDDKDDDRGRDDK